MLKPSRRKFIAGAASLGGLLGLGAVAWAMTVQPVVLDLTTQGRGMAGVVTVENTFANALPIEMRIEDLAIDGNGVRPTGKDSGDLLVFPPQTVIQPGQTQSFRIQYVGDPDLAKSKHYYVTAAQLPVQLPEGQSAIQILYNFQILVSVAPAGKRPVMAVTGAEVGQTAEGKRAAILTVQNTGQAHGYLSRGRLRVVVKNASGREVMRRSMPGPEIQQTIGFGLVGAEQTRRITMPFDIPAEGASVEAQFTPENQR